MTELIRAPLLESVESTAEPTPEQLAGQRAGLVFVPCTFCRAPLDLSLLGDAGLRLCDHHLLFDGLPLQ